MTYPPLNLTQAEIDDICDPLTNGAAQVRFLVRLGLLVARKPNGRALVARSEYERVRGAGRFQQAPAVDTAGNRPDREALLELLNKRSTRLRRAG